jgi:hypothetical protein
MPTNRIANSPGEDHIAGANTPGSSRIGVDRSTNLLKFNPDGTVRTVLDTGGIPDGTAAAPSLTFASDPTKGIYSSGVNAIQFSISGAPVARISAGGISALSDTGIFSIGAAYDVILTRDAANVLALQNATNAQKTKIGQTSTTVTSTAGSATLVATNLIPAGSIVLGVTARVTTLLTSVAATSFAIGDGSDADRWGTGIVFTAGTTTSLADATITSVPLYAAVTNVVLTPNTGTFTAGVVRLTVHYISLTAATS